VVAPADREEEEMRMLSIAVTSVFVDDQEKALEFYTGSWDSSRSGTSRWARPGG
jgi:hypothetical protein